MGEADRFFEDKKGRMMSVRLIVGNLIMTFKNEKFENFPTNEKIDKRQL
jgi:hypothetical protein